MLAEDVADGVSYINEATVVPAGVAAFTDDSSTEIDASDSHLLQSLIELKLNFIFGNRDLDIFLDFSAALGNVSVVLAVNFDV